jgi:hypothetical protein
MPNSQRSLLLYASHWRAFFSVLVQNLCSN